jgi:hypothetical protein
MRSDGGDNILRSSQELHNLLNYIEYFQEAIAHHSHSIVLSYGNVLIFRGKLFLRMMSQFRIYRASATIDIDRSIFDISCKTPCDRMATKNTVSACEDDCKHIECKPRRFAVESPSCRCNLIAVARGVGDRRSKELHLTDVGLERLHKAWTYWAEAQAGFDAAFGSRQDSELRRLMRAVTSTELVV